MQVHRNSGLNFNFCLSKLFELFSNFNSLHRRQLAVKFDAVLLRIFSQYLTDVSQISVLKISSNDFKNELFHRILENETVAVIVNLGTETEKICAKNIARDLPDSMTVHTPSFNSRFKIG